MIRPDIVDHVIDSPLIHGVERWHPGACVGEQVGARLQRRRFTRNHGEARGKSVALVGIGCESLAISIMLPGCPAPAVGASTVWILPPTWNKLPLAKVQSATPHPQVQISGEFG